MIKFLLTTACALCLVMSAKAEEPETVVDVLNIDNIGCEGNGSQRDYTVTGKSGAEYIVNSSSWIDNYFVLGDIVVTKSAGIVTRVTFYWYTESIVPITFYEKDTPFTSVSELKGDEVRRINELQPLPGEKRSGMIFGDPIEYIGFGCSDGKSATFAKVEIEWQPLQPAATPTFSVAPGTVDAGTTVEISTDTGRSTIYYTTNGEDPDTYSTKYEEPITITSSTAVKAITVRNHMLNSSVAGAFYKVIDPEASAVTFDFSDPKRLNPSFDKPLLLGNESVKGMTFTNGVVSISLPESETGVDNPRLYTDRNNRCELDLFAEQKFIVSVPSGHILGDIEFTFYKPNKLTDIECGNVGKYVVHPDDTCLSTWIKPDKKIAGAVDDIKFGVTDEVNITSITVNYKVGSITDGVENIAVDTENAPAEYYNLQGVRVDNPGPGLYIVRLGNSATKTLVR